jgi:hypothetical protein
LIPAPPAVNISAMSTPTQPIDLLDLLQKLFAGHGVEATIDDDWVRLDRPFTRCMARVVNETPHAAALVIQLDVLIYIGFGQLVFESFAGIGATRDEAVANAIEAFATGSLHVILATVFRPDVTDNQVVREEWPIGGRPWRVTIGGVACKGIGAQPPDTFGLSWVDQFRQRLEREQLPNGTHWIRIYHAQDGTRTEECEVLLDNSTWTTMQVDARQFDWPKSDGFSSVRLFLMLRRGANVADLAGVICQMRDAEDGVIREALTRRGVSPAVAEQAVALIPLAFGRWMIARMEMAPPPDEAIVMRDDKSQRTIRLADNAIFRDASRLVDEGLKHGTISKDDFEAIMTRSSEFQALNTALHAGSKPADLVFSPPVILASHDWNDDEPAVAMPSSAVVTPKKKPWWRFW